MYTLTLLSVVVLRLYCTPLSLSKQVSTLTADTFMSAFYVFYNPSGLLTPVHTFNVLHKKLIRRWDIQRELSLRRHCARTQNTIDSCINSATDRRGYVLERMFTKFSEITQYNGHYVVQDHSRSPILVPIESSYTTS